MNSYPDPNQITSEPLPMGEPEYREYPPASLQPRERIYPSAPAFPPDLPPPMANIPVPPMPYPYSPAGQSFQPPTPQLTSSFPVAKPRSRRWIFLLVSIGLAILALAGVLIYAILRSSAPNSTNVGSTSTGHSTSQPGVVSLGQSITIQGLTCTVTSIDPLAPDATTHPDAGNKFLVVHVRLQNDQNASQFYSALDFHVFSGDNQERDAEIIAPDTYTADHQLIEDDLPPHDTIQGDLIIQVPVNDHNVKLGWSPGNVSSDSAYEWDLGL